MDQAHDHVARADLCPVCYVHLQNTHLVRSDEVVYGGTCTCCGVDAHVILHCRYTMKKKEMERRGLL